MHNTMGIFDASTMVGVVKDPKCRICICMHDQSEHVGNLLCYITTVILNEFIISNKYLCELHNLFR